MKYIRRFLNLFKKQIIFDKKNLPEGWSVYDCIRFYEEYGYVFIDSRDGKDVVEPVVKPNRRHRRYKSKSNKNE